MEIRNMKKSLMLTIALTGFICMPVWAGNGWAQSTVVLPKEQQEAQNKQLFAAVGQSDIAAIEKSLADGADVSAIESDSMLGWTPLHHAVMNRRLDVVTCLVRNGANIVKHAVMRGQPGATPLEYSTFNGCLEILKYFISCGIDVNSQTNGTSEPLLHGAVRGGTLDAMKCLVENGADTKIKNRHGATALQFAIHLNNDPVLGGGYLNKIVYLALAGNYKDVLANGTNEAIAKFLKRLSPQNRDDILKTALTHNHVKTLQILNRLHPKACSWECMLAYAAHENVSETVGPLVANLGAHRLEHDDIKEIVAYAQANGKKNFGRAVRDFKIARANLGLMPVTTGADQDKILEQGISYKIMEFRG